MDFRDFAKQEASTFVDRLVAAAEDVRTELEERIAAIDADLDAAVEAHQRVDAERVAAEASRAREAAVRAQAEAARAQAEAARARVEEELGAIRATVSTLESARREATERIRYLETRVADAEAEAAATGRAFEAERKLLHSAVDKLNAELEAVRGHEATLRQQAEALRAEETTLRQENKALRAGEGALREQNETLRAEEATLRQENKTLRAGEGALREQNETAHGEAAALREENEALLAEDIALRQENEALRAECVALRKEGESLRTQGTALAEDCGTLRGEIDTRRRAEETASAVLAASARAIEALGAAADISGLFGVLVTAIAGELPRAALFRVKGNHLEGEHVAGPGDGKNMKKLVIPMSVDSVITRAVTRGALETAEGEELAQTRSPFGGAPASALAMPVLLGNETLAVLYAESDGPAQSAHATFAELLVGHTEVLLAKLTRELKTMKELREYAASLLQEAEEMFQADVEGGSKDKDGVRRLQDAIEYGRQLYAQRAALEGSMAADLFDEQIAAAIRTESRFGKALAAATRPDARRTAS